MEAIIGKETLKDHAQQLLAELDGDNVGILSVKKANQWLEIASKKPEPKNLYDGLWHEGEFCIFFADTNLGKSIYAVQMGVHIAQNGHVVLYIDFELSDKQFEKRYSENFTNHFNFPENFYRAEINTDEVDYKAAGFPCMEDYIAMSIESAIKEVGASVLIVDNITYLRTETEKAKDALPLVKHLNTLKKKLSISILCIAHTPKRDLSRPITQNDMAGSKMLMNMCDSAFAIGRSNQDSSLRYLKAIKSRDEGLLSRVSVYQVVKPDNFLRFDFIEYSSEREHLKELRDDERKAKAIEMRQNGKSYREIADELGTNHMAAKRMLTPVTGVTNVTSVKAV